MRILPSRGGFTLVELVTVMTMLIILVASISSSIVQAQKRSKIAAATAEAQELTNAILAYENYGELEEKSDEAATESSISFLLGEESEDGRQVPVLFNAAIRNGNVLDPWGMPYRITIKAGKLNGTQTKLMNTGVFFPNYCRLQAGEGN